MVVEWDLGVNKNVKRSGSDWSEPERIIEDRTRSGKQKRRLMYSQEKRTFNVAFDWTMTEFDNFQQWFDEDLRKGVFSFHFPRIDSTDKTQIKTYRIKAGGFPKYSNPTGQLIHCTMVWEEL